MKTFKINKDLEIICEHKKTRIAFKHEATLLKNGSEIDRTKICYQNRTWECFEFESVIEKLLDKTEMLTEKQKAKFLKTIKGEDEKETSARFKTIGGIAKMGDILCPEDKKAKNDWKAKMLKAGLENQGLIMPEDWDELSEDEKERRLNKVLEVLK